MRLRLSPLIPHDLRRWLFSVLRKDRYDRIQAMRASDSESPYTYKSFDRHHCIFVHVPKCAGVSVCKTLFGNLGGAHTTIYSYQLVFSSQEFHRYFKFSFVRNPWDRVFSAYRFLKKGGMTEEDRTWAADNLSSYGCFREFVTQWLNRSNIWNYWHFVPQSHYLCLPYRRGLAVDFVGLFENLNEDFRIVAKRLSLGPDIALKHENATSHARANYLDHYDDETRDIVADVYRRDIELLGYTFDNSSLSLQLRNRTA